MLNLRPNNHCPPDPAAGSGDEPGAEPVFSLQEGRDSDSAPGAESPVQTDSAPGTSAQPTAREDEDAAEQSFEEQGLPETGSGTPELLLRPLGFGEELRNLRAEAGMTIHDVAHEAQASQELIYNLEQEEWQKISVADFYCIACIERLCAVYKVSPDSLLQKFEDSSHAAGRQPSGARAFFGSRPGVNDTVFTPDELSGESIGSRGSRIPALVIGLLVLMLLVLLAGGWFVQRNRTAQREEILQQVEAEIPKLVVPEPVPLETLPIPSG